jgi:hypothetical protein
MLASIGEFVEGLDTDHLVNTIECSSAAWIVCRTSILDPKTPQIDELDVMATRCSSWRWGTKFESVSSEMQNKVRRMQTKFRRI